MKLLIFLLSFVALSAAAPVNLQAKYPFSVVLLDSGDEYYGLHWNFTRSTESIYFAVNVSTTGWIGFGLSPNGQMPGSDVVIGWVADGDSYFHDRYAEARRLPVIDSESQDWFLLNSEQTDGFTVLEFSRNFTSCDPQDLDVLAATSRVVWSYSELDPTDPTGAGAMEHDQRGTQSVNLLGGQPTISNTFAEDEPFLDISVSNVTIPAASTTYWCESFRAPEQLRDTVHYINRFIPSIAPHTKAFVHHIIVSQCPSPLSDEEVGVSMPCDELQGAVKECRGGLPYGGWAVGGEGFVFPEGVAYPIGGTGQDQFIMIEMHYDNPNNIEGVLDSSGMRFFYTTEEPELQAGATVFGHGVVPSMFIPPNTRNFTVTGICSSDCTSTYIPEGGIRIFANFLHTHLVGHGLTLEHYRFNTECDVWEELEPIDQNLNYDFNYQQYMQLPREHLVLPGDVIVLKCFYDTMDRDTVTIGGEATSEEMCLAFPFYYPRPPGRGILDACVSLHNPETSFTDFYTTLLNIDPAAAAMFANPNTSLQALNSLDWRGNPTLAQSLESSVGNSTNIGFCSASDDTQKIVDVRSPTIDRYCSYQAADRCTGFEPLSCCERLAAGAPPQIQISMGITLLLILLSVIVAA